MKHLICLGIYTIAFTLAYRAGGGYMVVALIAFGCAMNLENQIKDGRF